MNSILHRCRNSCGTYCGRGGATTSGNKMMLLFLRRKATTTTTSSSSRTTAKMMALRGGSFMAASQQQLSSSSSIILTSNYHNYRSHVTVTSTSADNDNGSNNNNPLLPLTNTEPRMPKTNVELIETIQPLADFWNIDDDDMSSLLLLPTKSDEDMNSINNNKSLSSLLTKERLVSILSLPLPGEDGWNLDSNNTKSKILRGLYALANMACTQYHGDLVHYRGLLEFSNICKSDCNYCGIRKSRKQEERYLLDYDTIMETARWSAERGYGSIMLQSGEVETPKRLRFLCKVVSSIISETGMGVSLSVGELPDEYYQQLYDAGAKRYLLRIETSNPDLFEKLHPQPMQTFEQRLDRLRALRRTGYMVGTGVMICLPTQSIEDLANDILFFHEEDIDMVGMGPYILQRGTPTGDWWCEIHPELSDAIIAKEAETATQQQLDLLNKHSASMFELTTRMIALSRLKLGDVNIAATTALQTIHPTGREVALMRGANILMPILTPKNQRTNYQLYEGKVCIDESASQCRSCLELRVGAAGKQIAYNDHGDPPHFIRRRTKQQQQKMQQ